MLLQPFPTFCGFHSPFCCFDSVSQSAERWYSSHLERDSTGEQKRLPPGLQYLQQHWLPVQTTRYIYDSPPVQPIKLLQYDTLKGQRSWIIMILQFITMCAFCFWLILFFFFSLLTRSLPFEQRMCLIQKRWATQQRISQRVSLRGPSNLLSRPTLQQGRTQAPLPL